MSERRVRFLSLSSSDYMDQNYEPVTADDLWYSFKDYDCLKCENDIITRSIRKSHNSDRSNLNSYCGVLLNAYKSCLKREFPNDTILQELARWLTVAISRRGLEKKSLVILYKLRREAIKKSIVAVLDAQASFQGTTDDKEEKIRLIYEDIATPSKLFALSLAQASWLGVEEASTIVITGMKSIKRHFISAANTSEAVRSSKCISLRSK
jgi:hypothetical protein